jgi:AcrR family transcriptional regulator
MLAEIKDVALRQLAEGGPQALSVSAIAKQLGVSGPALYRYYAGRDALLTELILDAYADLTTALTAAEPDLASTVAAFRAWATAQPHRYRLLFAAPLPGYDAHDDRLVAASLGAMVLLLTRVDAASPEPSPTLAGELAAWAQSRGLAETPPAVALNAITLWSRLHGLISLEIEGNFAAMGIDAGELFAREVRSIGSPAH